jgi:hypothetical protein
LFVRRIKGQTEITFEAVSLGRLTFLAKIYKPVKNLGNEEKRNICGSRSSIDWF